MMMYSRYLWISHHKKKKYEKKVLHPKSHWRKKSDPDSLARGTDPDPHQNVTDPNTASKFSSAKQILFQQDLPGGEGFPAVGAAVSLRQLLRGARRQDEAAQPPASRSIEQQMVYLLHTLKPVLRDPGPRCLILTPGSRNSFFRIPDLGSRNPNPYGTPRKISDKFWG